MARNRDEPFALYGLLAETIDVDPERTRVTFRLRPQARFSDGKPVTADDVIFLAAKHFAIMAAQITAPITQRWSNIETPDDRTVIMHLARRAIANSC